MLRSLDASFHDIILNDGAGRASTKFRPRIRVRQSAQCRSEIEKVEKIGSGGRSESFDFLSIVLRSFSLPPPLFLLFRSLLSLSLFFFFFFFNIVSISVSRYLPVPPAVSLLSPLFVRETARFFGSRRKKKWLVNYIIVVVKAGREG